MTEGKAIQQSPAPPDVIRDVGITSSKTWPTWENNDINSKTPPAFGPTFLNRRSTASSSTRKKSNIEDDDDTHGDDTNTVNHESRHKRATNNKHHHHHYTTTKKTRRQTGPLLRTLQSIQTATVADCARFQSGSFPYRNPSQRRMDVNDPRNRALTIMDITILGVPVPLVRMTGVGGGVGGGGQQGVVLGYVHWEGANEGGELALKSVRVRRRVGRCVGVGVGEGDDLVDPSSQLLLGKGGESNMHRITFPRHAWICFCSETLQELGVGPGTQLRLYDVVIVLPSSNIGGGGSVGDFPIVLCTRVCEPYPKELPSLPDVAVVPFDTTSEFC